MSRFRKQSPQDTHARLAASILGCLVTHKRVPDISQHHLSPSTDLPEVTLGRGLWGNPRLDSLTEATLGETYSTECYQCQIITEFNRMAPVNTQIIILPLHMCEFARAHTPLPKSCPGCTFPSAPVLTSVQPKVSWRSKKAGLSKLWLSAHKPS